MKIQIGIIVFVLIMVTIIMILAYSIEGVNTTVLWTLFLPIVVLRVIRCLLLIKNPKQ